MISIALLGSECTGKTTLAQLISEKVGGIVVPEYAREYASSGKVLELKDVMPIINGQISLEEEALKQAREKELNLIICDTIPLSSLIYSEHYYGTVPQGAEALSRRRYDLFFLLDIDVPWEADGIRDKPNEREQIQSLFVKGLERRNISYISLSGSLEERLNVVLARLRWFEQRHER